MSRIIFCATEEGLERQADRLRAETGRRPRRLSSDRGVLDALLDLETGRDVVALDRIAVTGWQLPDGVAVVFDPDLGEGARGRLRAQFDLRAHRPASNPAAPLLMSPKEVGERLRTLLNREAGDPFGPYTQAELTPEAA